MKGTVQSQIFARYPFSYFRLETGFVQTKLRTFDSEGPETNDVEIRGPQNKNNFSYDINIRSSKVRMYKNKYRSKMCDFTVNRHAVTLTRVGSCDRAMSHRHDENHSHAKMEQRESCHDEFTPALCKTKKKKSPTLRSVFVIVCSFCHFVVIAVVWYYCHCLLSLSLFVNVVSVVGALSATAVIVVIVNCVFDIVS